MQPHEERVVKEKAELDKKIANLKKFCFTDNSRFNALDPIDRDLLEDQYNAMLEYSLVLRLRIARFKWKA